MATSPAHAVDEDALLVQIASYNTNLQGNRGLPQDLVDWLKPTLQVSSFLSNRSAAPDIVAVGFQELLPLHFGLTGMSKAVMRTRQDLIQSQLEAHAPNGERYVLVGKTVYVGCALLVYARDDSVGRRVRDVQTQWTGFGPVNMGNKSAVAVRFRVEGRPGRPDELFTFVNAHFTAHAHNAAQRAQDWEHVLATLLFRAPDGSLSSLYETSHLFFHGDLNFRLHIPKDYIADGVFLGAPGPQSHDLLVRKLQTDEGREELREFDELYVAQRNGTLLQGLREAPFWKFKCSYKFALGEVDRYVKQRAPAWTDRILYTTYTDSPNTPEKSAITPLLYTTVPSYTTSDHKPLIALLAVPVASTSTSLAAASGSNGIPLIKPPRAVHTYTYFHYLLTRWRGKVAGWALGWVWSLLWFVGAGSSAIGLVNFVFGLGALSWWRRQHATVPTVPSA